MLKKRIKRFNISLTSLIILALIFISLFFVWQNARLRSQVNKLVAVEVISQNETPQPSITPEPTPTATSENECVITGCSDQICADEETITTCEFNEEYACYENATCERQDDGTCGWSQTEELTSCLNENPPESNDTEI